MYILYVYMYTYVQKDVNLKIYTVYVSITL